MSVSVGLFLGLVRFLRKVFSCLLRRGNESACQCSGCRMGKERWWSPYLVCRLSLLKHPVSNGTPMPFTAVDVSQSGKSVFSFLDRSL